MSLVIRGGSLPAPVHSWLSRSFSLASRASRLLHFLGQLAAMRSTACSQSCCSSSASSRWPLRTSTSLMPSRLASSRSCCRWPVRMSRCRSCSSMRCVQVVERGDRALFERAKIGESFELVVDLAALDPQRLDVDGNFQPAGAGGERFRLGLAAIDFVGQLAKLHGRLRPAAAFGHELVQLAAKLLASRRRACGSPISRRPN